MSNQQVQYTLSLKDQISDTLDKVDKKTSSLDNKFGGLQKTLAVIGGTAAIIGFGKSAITAFNESAQASAQLEAGLLSTGNAANLSSEALKKQAEALMEVTTFDDDAITGAQGLLVTFTNIKDKIFQEATPAILDMATRMKGDLQGATIQVGKALNDPIKGIMALSKVGVSFSEGQKAQIKNFVETNQLAKAQGMILGELNKEFGGSAEAAAKVGMGPWIQLGNIYGNVMEDLGGLILQMGQGLLPVVKGTISAFSDLVSFIKENSTMLKQLAMVVGIATVAYGAYIVATQGVAFVTNMATAAQIALNTAIKNNPIGLLLTGLALVVSAMVVAYNKVGEFRGVLWGLWGAVKAVGESFRLYFGGLGEVLKGVFTLDPSMIAGGVKNMASAVFGAGERIAKGAQEGYAAGMADFAKDQQAKKEETAPGGIIAPTAGLATAGTNANPTPSKSKSVAEGTKVTTINVSIKDLIGEYNLNVTNVREGSEKVKQMVVDALTGAVNDFQLIVQ